MKVRLKTIYAGPGGTALPGQEIDISADEARALIPRYAELIGGNISAPWQEKPTDDPAPQAAETSSARGFKCKICGESFTNPRTLGTHKKTHETG
jgi:hypothetical protein